MNLRDAVALGSGIAMAPLKGDAATLTPEEFEDRHGGAFLLLTAAELNLPGGPSSTEVSLLDEAPRGDSTASLRLMAFPVRSSESAPGGLVTIGRSANSDVVVPDLSISRFHAFARRGGDGGWRIHDAGSTNGTTVDGRNAPAQGHGEPIELKSGMTLRLGQVEFTFLDCEAMLAYLAKL